MRPSKQKKLLRGDKVEVRQHEEGLRGSWHAGVVKKARRLQRFVEYNELLNEKNNTKLVESIRVGHAIDGLTSSLKHGKTYRGYIRPLPPALENCEQKWSYGLCVDALLDDAWWEGVLLDNDEDSEERVVFFPDEGDEQKFHVKQLRVAQDWDESEGTWSVRGHWVLATMRENFEREDLSIKEIWYYLRQKMDFLRRAGEWTVGEESLWLKLMKEVIRDRISQPLSQMPVGVETSTQDLTLACSYMRRGEDLPSQYAGACLDSSGLEGLAQAQECKRDADSSLTPDNQTWAIVLRETLYPKETFDSGAAPDALMVVQTDGECLKNPTDHSRDKLWEVPVRGADLEDQPNCVVNELFEVPSSGADFLVQTDCTDKDLSEVPGRGADSISLKECTRIFGNGEVVKDQAPYTFSVGRESYKNLANGSDLQGQTDCLDRTLSKDSSRRAGLKEQTECLKKSGSKEQSQCVKVLSFVPANDADLKNKTDCIEKILSQSPAKEADLKDQAECKFDRVSSKDLASGLEDGMTSTKGRELSNGRSFSLVIDGKPVQQHRPGRISTQSWEPSAKGETVDAEYCPPAALNYNLALDKTVKKQARIKAKMHLLAVGWRFEFKSRRGHHDVRYISPTGQIYYSLLQACSAWKQQQKIQGVTDGNHEDNVEADKSRKCIPVGVSSSPLQKTRTRVSRNMSSSAVCPKRSRRVYRSGEVAKHEYNNNEIAEDALKNHIGIKRRVFRSQKMHNCVNKRRNVSGEMIPLTETATGCTFESESFDQENVMRSASTEGSKPKKSRQGLLAVSGFSSKKHKLGSEDLLEGQKRKRGRPCRLLKRKGKPGSGYRMQVLPSTPGKSKDLSSGQVKRTVRSVLSWMIENGMVAPNQKVFYWNRKENCPQAEGWITCEGIMCACCKKLYSLTNFEVHAGSKNHRPSANLILEDGRSLLQCQMQVLDDNNKLKGRRASSRERRKKITPLFESDDVCNICHVGGTLILCDHCPSSFHLECIQMELLPEGNWYCPSCRCVLCGGSEFNGDPECFTEMTILFCDQCERQYHVGCLYERGMPKLDSCPEGNWFCSKKCSEIFSQLRNLVGAVNLVGVEGLSWTMLRSREEDHESCDPLNVEVMAEHHSKLSVALTIMHECFVPIIESRTKKDLIAEVIFNRGSDINRLNFRGFYTIILERGDELISVATLRIHGERVAEMPLIGTRVEYRRKGMCRILVNELEKLLHSVGVEKLILPAVSELKQTWENAFGFREISSVERLKLLDLSFVGFPDTVVLHKLLTRHSLEREIVTGTIVSENGVDVPHLSLGSRNERHEFEKGTHSGNDEITTSKIGPSYTEVEETVTPICSLPYDTRTCSVWHNKTEGENCADIKMGRSLLKDHQVSGSTSASQKKHTIQENITEDICQSESTSVDDDVDDESVVVVGTTRSNRLVRQVRWKVAYSYHRNERKTDISDELRFNDTGTVVKRKRRSEGNIYKRRRKEQNVTDNNRPVITCATSLGLSNNKEIQFDSFGLRKPDVQVSIDCGSGSTAALDNRLSTLEESAVLFDRPKFPRGGSKYEASYKSEDSEGNVVGNSDYPRSNEFHRKDEFGYLSIPKSFKYFYSRRRKQICAGNVLSGKIQSDVSLPVGSSILQSHTVC